MTVGYSNEGDVEDVSMSIDLHTAGPVSITLTYRTFSLFKALKISTRTHQLRENT